MFKYIWGALKVWGITWCILSVGYVVDSKILERSDLIEFTVSYFLCIFAEGVLVVLVFILLFGILKRLVEENK